VSVGPSRLQKAILDELKSKPSIALTHPKNTPAEQSAIRRAASRLERDGLIKIVAMRVEGRSRLCAVAPDSTARSCIVTGLDGKTYRLGK
jgi:DNA-binding transcriptional ArsR family regulator